MAKKIVNVSNWNVIIPVQSSVRSKYSDIPWLDCDLSIKAAATNWIILGCPKSFF